MNGAWNVPACQPQDSYLLWFWNGRLDWDWTGSWNNRSPAYWYIVLPTGYENLFKINGAGIKWVSRKYGVCHLKSELHAHLHVCNALLLANVLFLSDCLNYSIWCEHVVWIREKPTDGAVAFRKHSRKLFKKRIACVIMQVEGRSISECKNAGWSTNLWRRGNNSDLLSCNMIALYAFG